MKSSQAGQMTVEMVLLLVVVLAIGLVIQRTFVHGEFANKLVSGPWDQVSGMIENGKFGKPDKTRGFHPGHGSHHLSVKGTAE